MPECTRNLANTITSNPPKPTHFRQTQRFSQATIYAKNIQIADLNALNAALAVIRWKKYFGVYIDLGHEHHANFALNGNVIINEDKT